jgi:sugar lactone lactonase YvrE
VPKQYGGTKPACVYVNRDGLQWSANIVFDNLIARGELPAIIGVFVRPGVVRAASAASVLDRFDRSYEHDGLGDAYTRFLLEELLPVVETKSTSDGRALKLSSRGADRASGGSSSGAIAAFTAAWERPDAFTRVFSSVCTFVGLGGGDIYPTFIRKFEPKPLRVFLVDGSNDDNTYAGDWWMANQTMQRALVYSNYEVRHVWGDDGHNARHGTQVFPDAMRWLWSGWPLPVKVDRAPLERLGPSIIPGEDWQLVGEGYRLSEGTVVNAKGEMFFTDIPDSKRYKIGLDGKPGEFIADTKRANGQAFGPDGRLYAVATGSRQVLAYGPDHKPVVIADEIGGNDLVVAHNGNIYVTAPPVGNSNDPSRVVLVKPDGSKHVVDIDLRYANGIALSPDQSLLYVADYRSHCVYGYVVQPDGTLAHKQRYYWLHEPDTDDQSYADGLKVDRNGNLWVAKRLGIQICDQAGELHHPDAERQVHQPRFRRRETRYTLRLLQRESLQTKTQRDRRQRVGRAEQTARAEIVSADMSRAVPRSTVQPSYLGCYRIAAMKRRTRAVSTAPDQCPPRLNSEPTMKPSASARNSATFAAVTPEPM